VSFLSSFLPRVTTSVALSAFNGAHRLSYLFHEFVHLLACADKNIRTVGVSAVTGAGMPDFFAAVDAAATEYDQMYVPFLNAKFAAKQAAAAAAASGAVGGASVAAAAGGSKGSKPRGNSVSLPVCLSVCL
jgi:hypothetical protein